MARLTLQELFDAIERHPDYLSKWHGGVSARELLRIVLTEERVYVQSEVMDASDGREVVLDVDPKGRVAAVEFV